MRITDLAQAVGLALEKSPGLAIEAVQRIADTLGDPVASAVLDELNPLQACSMLLVEDAGTGATIGTLASPKLLADALSRISAGWNKRDIIDRTDAVFHDLVLTLASPFVHANNDRVVAIFDAILEYQDEAVGLALAVSILPLHIVDLESETNDSESDEDDEDEDTDPDDDNDEKWPECVFLSNLVAQHPQMLVVVVNHLERLLYREHPLLDGLLELLGHNSVASTIDVVEEDIFRPL